ncbi:hypothetical protein, partial [Salinibacterium sp.]|uniref:hypothetical protein n=1 Tax=Salinibacterium sp. TaxID=1915057 RepID=UPI00286A340E
ATGRELPIVEATPETLSAVLGTLIEHPELIHSIGKAGVDFVEVVHSGRFSADVLRAHWID